MSYVTKPDTGSLFKNDKKESDKHPNAKGSALIGGVEYWVSAWTKETKDGDKWQSLSFQAKEAKKEQTRPQEKKAAAFDDDIPY